VIKELKQKTWLPTVALMCVAAVWGSTFVVMQGAVARYPMFAFLSLRFALAAVTLAIAQPRAFKKFNKANLRLGIAASAFLAMGYILQTASLLPADQGGTTPARSAFLTGMYVVMVPVLSTAFRRKMPGRGIIIGVVLALAGLGALSGLSPSGGVTHWVRGDSLVLGGALGYSLHMLVLGRAGQDHDARALSIIQMGMLAIICGVISVATGEHASAPTNPQVLVALLITSLFASTFAYTVQTWAQLKLPPSRVALILVLEPAFGGIFGWAVAGHVIWREVIGAGLMLAGMIISELLSARSAEAQGQQLEPAPEGIPVYAEE
jgi:drug/metabolite transporter (DMT)-like permease